jgi:hypothetical protein
MAKTTLKTHKAELKDGKPFTHTKYGVSYMVECGQRGVTKDRVRTYWKGVTCEKCRAFKGSRAGRRPGSFAGSIKKSQRNFGYNYSSRVDDW